MYSKLIVIHKHTHIYIYIYILIYVLRDQWSVFVAIIYVHLLKSNNVMKAKLSHF